MPLPGSWTRAATWLSTAQRRALRKLLSPSRSQLLAQALCGARPEQQTNLTRQDDSCTGDIAGRLFLYRGVAGCTAQKFITTNLHVLCETSDRRVHRRARS